MNMQSKQAIQLRLITHNIRYAATTLSPGEAPWEERLPLLASQFRYQTFALSTTVLCLQEVLKHQLDDLLDSLNTSPLGFNEVTKNECRWISVGVGRDDGEDAGEFNPILFKPSIWELMFTTTAWLSPKPKQRGWDAGSNRIATMARLRHRETGQMVVVVNTHLDDQGSIARREESSFLVRLCAEWIRNREKPEVLWPLLLAGDLNSEVEGEAYVNIALKLGPDVQTMVAPKLRYGNEMTFTEFSDDARKGQRLDFIFAPAYLDVKPAFRVIHYAVLPNRFEDGVFHSDHRAVVADLELLG